MRSASFIDANAGLGNASRIGKSMTTYFATTPLFIIAAGTLFIVLMALTMRAIVRREKAMINSAMDEPHEVAAYQQRWRSAA